MTSIEMRSTRSRSARLCVSAVLAAGIAVTAAGCQTTRTADTTGSIPIAAADRPDADWRRDIAVYEQQYRTDPGNAEVAMRLCAGAPRHRSARAGRGRARTGLDPQSAQPGAAWRLRPRARRVGNYAQAFDVLGRAHTPDQPDWRILSAQGTVLDQMGRHAEAQRYYASALKIVPEEPSVLSNLGLSYALSKDLRERRRRRCGVRRRRAGSIPAFGKISRSSSACRAVSRKPRPSRVPICRPTRPPPMSRTCGRCWRRRA